MILEHLEKSHGSGQMKNQDFVQELLKFLKKQDLSKEYVIPKEVNVIIEPSSPPKERQVNVTREEEPDPITRMKQQLQETKKQYLSLLNSGAITDERQKKSIKQIVESLDQ